MGVGAWKGGRVGIMVHSQRFELSLRDTVFIQFFLLPCHILHFLIFYLRFYLFLFLLASALPSIPNLSSSSSSSIFVPLFLAQLTSFRMVSCHWQRIVHTTLLLAGIHSLY